jgi:hypothetical protein
LGKSLALFFISAPDIIILTTTKGYAMPIMLTDGNAFAIIGAGRRELEKLGRGDEVAAFTAEMTSGDYDHLLQTMIKWFPDVDVAI